MGRTAVSHATPSLLAWARRTAGYDVEDAASALSISSNRLEQWEQGNGSPSIAQLKSLAKKYKRPLAVFYLPSPPADFTVPNDYRLLPGGSISLSPAVRWELRRAEEVRAAALDLADDLEIDVHDFQIVNPETRSTTAAAQDLRARLGITVEQQAKWKQPYDALNGWREAIEASGVLVVQVSRIDEQEQLSGACIHHSRLPIIILNRATTPRRRIFTLLHEYAHLMIGTGGVCDLHDGDSTDAEVICNRIAAAALMPRKEFLAHAIVQSKPPASEDWTDEDLDAIAKSFAASPEAVLRRALTLGLTTQRHYEERRSDFEQLYRLIRSKQKKEMAESTSGINQAPIIVGQTGYTVARWALEAFDRRLINTNELSGILDAKVKWIPKVRQIVGAT